ncbi:uncharacterized protein LOC130740794 [Lotus japonicus]|uniref:uncharacterized protein LOC130740794 n=1 Tax=Lotus japonicus TaxID=34305 RepID=UPI002588C36C|nr:uncharacterized protein LOC130740794 [Lotus japonicus]
MEDDFATPIDATDMNEAPACVDAPAMDEAHASVVVFFEEQVITLCQTRKKKVNKKITPKRKPTEPKKCKSKTRKRKALVDVGDEVVHVVHEIDEGYETEELLSDACDEDNDDSATPRLERFKKEDMEVEQKEPSVEREEEPPKSEERDEVLPEPQDEDWVSENPSKAKRKVQSFFCLLVNSYFDKEGDIYCGLRNHMLREFTNESIPDDEPTTEEEEEDEDDDDDEAKD